MIRLLSLNVTNGGLALHRPLLARLDELAPDLIALHVSQRAVVASQGRDPACRSPSESSAQASGRAESGGL